MHNRNALQIATVAMNRISVATILYCSVARMFEFCPCCSIFYSIPISKGVYGHSQVYNTIIQYEFAAYDPHTQRLV